MAFDLSGFKDYPHYKKAWGEEIWLCNHPLYCAKLLILEAGHSSSLHYHEKKHETFFVIEGRVMMQVQDRTDEKHAGDSICLHPGTLHRFRSLTSSSLVLEVSTEHDDADTYRREPSI